MLEERDAEIAARIIRERVLLAALEPFVRAWCLVADQPILTQRLTLAQIAELACHELSGADFQRARRAAAAYPTHSEVRSLTDEEIEIMDRALMKSTTYVGDIEPAISPMQVQHAIAAWNRLPEGARVEDRMKAALETLGPQSFKCVARSSPFENQDCDWPVCGCDPYADKVMAALDEAGQLGFPHKHQVHAASPSPSALMEAMVLVPREPTPEMIESGARRIAWSHGWFPERLSREQLSDLTIREGVSTDLMAHAGHTWEAMLASALSPKGGT